MVVLRKIPVPEDSGSEKCVLAQIMYIGHVYFHIEKNQSFSVVLVSYCDIRVHGIDSIRRDPIHTGSGG